RGNVRTRWLRDARKTDQQRSPASRRTGTSGRGQGPRGQWRRDACPGSDVAARRERGRRHVGGPGDARGVVVGGSVGGSRRAGPVRSGWRAAAPALLHFHHPPPGVIRLLRCPRDACLPLIGSLIFI
ncbi:hypothetical protein PVAP13_1KG438515, partial [Panicum virgatum]